MPDAPRALGGWSTDGTMLSILTILSTGACCERSAQAPEVPFSPNEPPINSCVTAARKFHLQRDNPRFTSEIGLSSETLSCAVGRSS